MEQTIIPITNITFLPSVGNIYEYSFPWNLNGCLIISDKCELYEYNPVEKDISRVKTYGTKNEIVYPFIYYCDNNVLITIQMSDKIQPPVIKSGFVLLTCLTPIISKYFTMIDSNLLSKLSSLQLIKDIAEKAIGNN